MSTFTTSSFGAAAAPAPKRYPRVARIDRFVSTGCLFHVTNGSERFRVEDLGGEETFTRMILDELRPGDVLFDVGACIGMVAVHAAALRANVVAFEPEPNFRARLVENLELNQLAEQVRVIDWAVSSGPGEAELFTDGVAGRSPSLQSVGERAAAIRVRTDAIDRAIARSELSPPNVIKFDVEGAETLALRGMQTLLGSAARPRAIYIELHPEFLPSFGSTVDEAAGLIESAGYRVAYEERRFDQIHRLYRK